MELENFLNTMKKFYKNKIYAVWEKLLKSFWVKSM